MHLRRFPDKKLRGARLALAATLLVAVSACDRRADVPQAPSKEYDDTVAAFSIGLAALQVGDDVQADARLAEVTRLAPGEPAGWANWGVLALRQRNFDLAAQRLDKAREQAPRDGGIRYLQGLLARNRGDSAQAIADLRKAVELDPKGLQAAYALAEEIERQAAAGSEAEYRQTLQKILAAQPDNLAVSLEIARAAAKRGDAATLASTLNSLEARAGAWPPEVREQLANVKAAAAGADVRAAATRTTFLRNALMRVPEYRQSLARVKAPPGEEARPLTHFLRMKAPVLKPSPADMALGFKVEPIANTGAGPWSWLGAISLGSEGVPIVATANGEVVRLANGATLPFPGGAGKIPPTPEGVLPLDFSYDFKTDLALAGAGGVRLFRQDSATVFTDVTGLSKLPKALLDAAYNGAWAADIEADGDLDIVLGTRQGIPVVLRNNGDGTFLAIKPFTGISGVRGFAWADLDADGTPDATIIDEAGKLHIFMNERQGQFRERALPADPGAVKAIAVADATADGVLDILAVHADGRIVRISDRNEGQGWDIAEIARVPDAAQRLAGEVRLRVADLDNNGALDLYLQSLAPTQMTAALVWLGDEKGGFALLPNTSVPASVFAAADLGGNGKLDLLGLAADASAVRAVNRGTKGYHWQVVRPRAAEAVGDQRINPFGVGGEIEVRSGLLVQKQPITGPLLHFGLGEHTSAEIVRVVWPNGTVRAEFGVKGDQEVVTEQRLKASCPFLFAWNGERMEFVKDAVPWGSAIGLSINTLGSMKIAATGEWYKIRRDQLVPHNGYYDIRVTAELWEVYYYDQISLMTVDHPVGTEVFVDERFTVPPAKLAVTTVETPRPIKRALDDNGQDVTAFVAKLDGKALDTFGRGQYQGVTRDHYVEVDLGDDAPASGPLFLIAHGSIHDTESSINVAITQGERWRARNLSFEVPDGHGGWVVARKNLGFPAGRKKTILFDLTDVFRPGTPRKIRIWTNLEIYWDHLEWARGLPHLELRTTRLNPTVADLHYRGYSVITRPDAGAPEIPDYNRMAGSKQRWRDLIGYYTRYGEVRELLENIDDRYVIVNSGDEMSLRFAEQPAPPAGWVRDFVVTGDGWIKDGDYNSTHSRTVLPLPYHAQAEYLVRPGKLEDEWPYRQHPEDWQNYHTRYVTPEVFRNALRDRPGP
jgi:tetratricopeptide (TPR) repeat protein